MKKSGIIIFKNIRSDMAHLVESLKNDRQEMNVIQIVFDTNFGKKEILNKIVLFIDFFNNFINNTEMKIKLLNNPNYRLTI